MGIEASAFTRFFTTLFCLLALLYQNHGVRRYADLCMLLPEINVHVCMYICMSDD